MTRNIIIKDDDEIIQECLSGNTDSYKNLVDKYQIRIINTCYKYTKNVNDAEDVAQEVFLKAFQNLSKFKFDSKFYSWIYRIAVNTSLNFINSREKRNEKETISEENCLNDVNISNDNPREYYQLNELIDKIQPLIDKLPEELIELIKLYEIKDFTYEDISKKLNIPVGTVRSRLHRARNMLISEFRSISNDEK
jgi:RNA polymerase sigma-70 factor (ECF subfamily)